MSLSPLPLEALAPLSRAADLVHLLERWVERGWLRALDKAFVGFLHELDTAPWTRHVHCHFKASGGRADLDPDRAPIDRRQHLGLPGHRIGRCRPLVERQINQRR